MAWRATRSARIVAFAGTLVAVADMATLAWSQPADRLSASALGQGRMSLTTVERRPPRSPVRSLVMETPSERREPFTCSFELWDWHPVQLELYMEITATHLTERLTHTSSSWGGSIRGTFTAHVPYSASDQTVRCFAIVFASDVGEFIWEEKTFRLPAVGDDQYRITLNSFIPFNIVPDPEAGAVYSFSTIYGGNDRGFSVDGDSKTTQILELLNPYIYDNSFVTSQVNFVGLTERYDYWTSVDTPGCCLAGRLTGTAKHDWIWGHPLKVDWGTAGAGGMNCQFLDLFFGLSSAILTLNCSVAADNPLTLVSAPPIFYDVHMEFTFRKFEREVGYNLTGIRTAFPAFEFYLGGTPMFQSWPAENNPALLFFHAPVSGSGSGR